MRNLPDSGALLTPGGLGAGEEATSPAAAVGAHTSEESAIETHEHRVEVAAVQVCLPG